MKEEQQQGEVAIPAGLLKAAQNVKADIKTEKVDPMEKIPTLGIGKELLPGMTLAGYFDSTQEIPSPKSKQVNEQGERVFTRHILRVGSPTGERLAVWSTAALSAFFETLNPGTYVVIKYIKKGTNAAGNSEHFFEFQRELPRLNS